MLVVPFLPAHLIEIQAQPQTPKDLSIFGDPSYGESLSSGGEAFTVFHDGEILACLGVFQFWPGRGVCWAVLSSDLRKHMVGLSKRIRTFFDQSGYRRLEATIAPDFPAAIRWAELLGFERECLMRAYTPSGADQYLYSRVRID
jgi:hypothetical protein